MNTIIVLVALVGYAASAAVPQVFVKSVIPDVVAVGTPLGSHLQTPLYPYPNPLIHHHSVVTPKFAAGQFVGSTGPFVGTVGPHVGIGPHVGVAGPLFAGHHAPLINVPAPSYKTENYQTPFGAKSEIRDDAGQYSLSYATPEGVQVSERSFLKLGPHGDYIPVKEGIYKYISPEGIPVSYGYKADENGFNVQGSPLPVAPSA